MNNEEALALFKNHEYMTDFSWQDEMSEIAIKALEKQIPKKLKITQSTKRCASCNRQISGIGNIHSKRHYCVNCGQKIDWEGEEE